MYHQQKRDFEPANPKYVRLAQDVDEHYHLIVDEIADRLIPTSKMEGQRSVIVFFRDAAEIEKFRSSSYFAKYREKANVLTELTASRREERNNIIKSATRQGMITLASCMFGRGTDFKIYDDRMETAGGMHVLQTFFSYDLSEEVQIQGRCARQGYKGSYSLVLLKTSVAGEFDLDIQIVGQWQSSEVYSKLCELRAKAGETQVKMLREMKKERLQEHDILVQSLKSLFEGRSQEFKLLMRRYNSSGGLCIGPRGLHIIMCLDESGSMHDQWDELVSAFNAFWNQSIGGSSNVSVVQFGTSARITHQLIPLEGQPPNLTPSWSGTAFLPAIRQAENLINCVAGPAHGYTTVIVFMSDGESGDVCQTVKVLESLASEHTNQFACYTVGFGRGASITLERMAFSGGVHNANNFRTASIGSLVDAFTAVARSISPGRL